MQEVIRDLGYNVTEVQEDTTQQTPDEAAAEAEAAQVAEQATKDAEAEEAAKAEETDRLSRNQRRKAARERDQQAIKDATERADKVQRDFDEFKARTTSEFEEIRKNPPRAPEPEKPLEAPKRPTRAEFFENTDDPETAYEDALRKYWKALDKYESDVEERSKPKPEPKAEPKAEPAPAQTGQPDVSDAAVKGVKLDDIKNPNLRDFYDSLKRVTDGHPGAFKSIHENNVNMSQVMFGAVNLFDEPARIALYLAQHPEESKRIKALTDGKPDENPRLARIAKKELDKIEQLAAAEDAARKATGSDQIPPIEEDTEEVDAQPAAEPTAPPKSVVKAAAAPAKAEPKKKAQPIDPVGARGSQSQKRYEDMTADEMKKLDIDEVRRMTGRL